MLMEARQPFGSLLKRHRLTAGLTHERLAERSTVSVRAISDLERGVSRRPHPDTVALLAGALQLTPDQRAVFEAAARSPIVEKADIDHLPSNLPVQLASFVGREREVRALRGLLQRRDVRLVTLTGPGGSGKTRLSIQAATEMIDVFGDGVVFVSLAPVSGPDDVAHAIARAFDESDPGTHDPVAYTVERIGDRRLLLLIDNFEHVVTSAPVLLELLGGCRNLTLLVTSRAALRLSGEQEFPVAPLRLPDIERLPPAGELIANPAIALFVDRATRVRPDFALTDDNAAVVATICARLDGLPLAIELAAARLKVLTPTALLDRLGRGPAGARLWVLGGGARDLPERQRTMHDTIAWSYNLLDDGEQFLLRCLAVFPGGCTLDAATAVCRTGPVAEHAALEARMLNGMASLLDNSLIYRLDGPDDEPRCTILETIREFALEQLQAAGESADLRRRHAAYYLAIVESTGALLFAGPRERARAAAEQDNIDAALRWLVEHG
jgi:predicted ATPase